MKVNILQLRKNIQKILTKHKFTPSQSRAISDVLIYAELVGKNTQGVIKFLGNEPVQNIAPAYAPKIIKETKLSILIDGGKNPGMMVTHMGVGLAIKKAKKYGFSLVGTQNTYSSTGALGYYANKIAEEDFIGIVMSGTPKGVTPFGSIDKLVGINPIAFGFPTETDPLIFDMATAAITWYGLVRAKILGKKIPKGVAVDTDGNETEDPDQAMKGAILTFGNNRKMSGLNLMIEMFTGPLLGAISPGSDGKWYTGSLIVVIDPKLLIDIKQLKRNSSLILKKIKSSRVNKDVSEIILPGENAVKMRKKAEESGFVEIDDDIYRDFMQVVSR